MQEMYHIFGGSKKKFTKSYFFYICLTWAVLLQLEWELWLFPNGVDSKYSFLSKFVQWRRYCCCCSKSHEVAQLTFDFMFISGIFKHASWQNVSWKRDEAAASWLFSPDYDSPLMLTICSELNEEYYPKGPQSQNRWSMLKKSGN